MQVSFSDPEKIIADAGIAKASQVADIGAGSGFYSFAAAKAVGPQGNVFALEVQKDLLEKIKNEAIAREVKNLMTVWGDAEKMNGTRLRDHSINTVILANILFQIHDKEALLAEVKRILVPGGNVLVVDWSESFGGLGPRTESVFNQEDAEKLFSTHEFSMVRTLPAGEHHYGIIFQT